MEVSKKVVFIKDWILNYVNSMPKKAESLVIGISGGIDSSVTSTLCAMTGIKTIVLTMPIKQISSQHDLSLRHEKWLKNKFNNIHSHIIELDEVFESFKLKLSNSNLWRSISKSSYEGLSDMAAANNQDTEVLCPFARGAITEVCINHQLVEILKQVDKTVARWE